MIDVTLLFEVEDSSMNNLLQFRYKAIIGPRNTALLHQM